MSIQVTCPVCGRKLKAPDTAAGAVLKCPNCGDELRIPSAPKDDDAKAAHRSEETPSRSALSGEPRAKGRAGSQVPEYGGLENAALILWGVAMLDVIGAAVVVLVGVVRAVAARADERGVLVIFFAVALGMLITGAFTYASSEGCNALRDIARNSWKSLQKQDVEASRGK